LGETLGVVGLDFDAFFEGIDEILHLFAHADDVFDDILRVGLDVGGGTAKNLEKRG
jgi:hypothetical protein